MCSVSDSPPSRSFCTSSFVALGSEPARAVARRRFAGGGGDSAQAASASASSCARSTESTGKHWCRNQVGDRPSSRCFLHSLRLASSAASSRWCSCFRKLGVRPPLGASRSFAIRTLTSSSMRVGRKACRWRMEKRDLMRFSSMPITSILSDMPTMQRRTPTSWAMSKRLYSSVCRAREQKCSNLSSTITTALACWKLSLSTLRIHSMPCSKEALACGAVTS
mmetsp:Transcript_88650/g.228644  ORF Transcript_88650/g.228644 Transcript_88650/m.228644 type:complete len:222 (+) Transcript_88650:555-1220(+)